MGGATGRCAEEYGGYGGYGEYSCDGYGGYDWIGWRIPGRPVPDGIGGIGRGSEAGAHCPATGGCEWPTG
ncbi:Hypothetical protein RY70_278 [Bifidobacterium bifidum]|nr:Hypothetical protein RY70_278 [Bifidobacterium bifidum]